MRYPLVCTTAVCVLALASACRRTLVTPDADAHLNRTGDSSADVKSGSACFPLFHACTTNEECCGPYRCLNITGTPACQQEGPAGDAGIPTTDADAGTCPPPPGDPVGVICFGSDPAPYQQYLTPADGGVAPGQCPTVRDFTPARGEGCGYTACGPLLGSAVSNLQDAGAVAGDAGADCCFLVARLCGV